MTARTEHTNEQRRYLNDIAETANRLAEDHTSVGDLKIVAGALREMATAFGVFAPYRQVRKVSTFGSARTKPGDRIFDLAERFARQIADAGFMVITGAGPGIMEACQRGAGRERSFGVNIRLPFEQTANAVIEGDTKLLTFRYFFTRKLFFLKEAHAVVLFPGGFGTHDEGFETLTLLQTGKTRPMPLVLLDEPQGTYWKTWQRYVEDHILRRGMIGRDDLALYKVTDDVATAVGEITAFYRVYHSSRFVRDHFVLRLTRQLPAEFVQQLTDEFRDIVTDGIIEQRAAFSAEGNEPEIFHLPRLVFRFDRVHYGRLRQLIDRLNLTECRLPGPS
ncbi:LOG family protein [Candidatus Binatia bacterium]|nr:LOG family protein [Candidatus Binatia bacterium]